MTSENAQTLQQLVTGVVEGAAELAEGTEKTLCEVDGISEEGQK